MAPQDRARALRFILCLGVVSLFADMTYEGARSIIGPFLKDLGASAAQVGLIAGFGEMLAASLRFFTGRLVDRPAPIGRPPCWATSSTSSPSRRWRSPATGNRRRRLLFSN